MKHEGRNGQKRERTPIVNRAPGISNLFPNQLKLYHQFHHLMCLTMVTDQIQQNLKHCQEPRRVCQKVLPGIQKQ
jgi:hypothetical protein